MTTLLPFVATPTSVDSACDSLRHTTNSPPNIAQHLEAVSSIEAKLITIYTMGVDDGVAQASSSSSGQPNEQRIRAERAAAAAAARLRGEVPLSPTGPASTQSGRDDVEDESDGDEAQAGAASRQSINSVQAANSVSIRHPRGSHGESASLADGSIHHCQTLPSVSNTQVEALAATLSTGATISAPNPAASSTPNDLVKSLSEQLECCEFAIWWRISVQMCIRCM